MKTDISEVFYDKYFNQFNKTLANELTQKENKLKLLETSRIIVETHKRGNKIILIGNGGSAAIADHMAIDFTKNARLCAMSFSSSALLTTFSNDYGYENVFQKAVEHYGKSGDLLIAISSSGASKNILKACSAAKEKNIKIVTFSGFSGDNPLRKMGEINFWVDSKAFGHVELIHNILTHFINDMIVGEVEYIIR